MRRPADQGGFTLAELLPAVVILGLLVALGAWSAQRQLAGLQVESALRRLAVGLERGRTAALRLGRPCALALEAHGWVPVEAGGAGACTGADLPLGEGVADGEVTLSHTFPEAVRFSSNGLVLDGGTAVVSAAGTALRRCLVLSLPLGVVRVGRYAGAADGAPSAGACQPDPSL